MYLYRCLALFILLALCIYLQAQNTVPSYLGTKTTYHPQQTKHASSPAGYEPVFINYVGRHGARFMTKPGSDLLVTDVLKQADKQNALTPTGMQALQAVVQFDSVEKNNYENITLLGADEQKQIGERLYSEYKSVFDGKPVDVLMTTKVRTQQSADAFLKGLPNVQKENIHRIVLPDSTDAMLRFYDMSPAYDQYVKSKAVQRHLDTVMQDERTAVTANHICQRLFTKPFTKALQDGKIEANIASEKKETVDAIVFAQAFYDVYTIWFSAIKEMQKSCRCQPNNYLQNAFAKEDLQWLDLINNAEDFYAKGPAEDTLGIQIAIAAPLLLNFINTTDSVVGKTKPTGSILRFTHAEAISPFATLLGIPQASAVSRSAYDYQQHWQASEIIPLSANIQWILYTNGKQYVVKVLLNEKEIKLPVSTTTFPYYDWLSVRQFYISRLTQLGITL